MRATVILSLIAALGLSAVPVAAEQVDGRYQEFGDATGFRNLLPPGQDGNLNGEEQMRRQGGEEQPYVTDQLDMYAELLEVSPGVTTDDLDRVFKDASFGVRPGDVGRTYRPGGREDVLVIRDESFGVPHIYGDTREGTMFAKGYTTAEDRLFLIDVLRHAGRARLSEFLGATEYNIETDRAQLAVAPYREEDLAAQTVPRTEFGELGERIRADGDAYVAGVNAYIQEALADPSKLPAEYPALQKLPEPYTLEDVVAIASLVGGIFGAGGGEELTNYCAIQELAEEVGPAEARATFDDLKMADDPEAPRTTNKRFDYMNEAELGPVDPAAIPPIDCATLRPIGERQPSPQDVLDAVESVLPGGVATADGPFGELPLVGPRSASNAVLVTGERTATGQPLAVFGPQTAYFSPQLLVEADVHGPDIDVRGMGFAGIDTYVQIGRGADYAWSATTSLADAKDTFVVELCEPGGGTPTIESMGHLHDGECLPIESWNHTQVAPPTAAAGPDDPPREVVLSWPVERSPVYGPLVARAQLEDGTPVGLAVYRSTYFRETLSALGFHLMNSTSHMSGGVEAFREAMGEGNEFSFNWFYVDDESVAYQSSCRCPRRARGVDPFMPTWGTGEFDWNEWLSKDDKPWDVDPDDGVIISWNNGQAPGWLDDDNHFSRGPVDRSQLLERRMEPLIARGDVTLEEVVDVTAEGATGDLRAQEVVPVLEGVLGTAVPAGVDPRAAQVWDELRAWAADRMGHRRDRDGDGSYEHATAIAVMDAWWPHLTTAVFGDLLERFAAETTDPPQLHLGSAWNHGSWGQLHKDLRTVAGVEVAMPMHRTYCGDGDLDACRAALWSSLEAAFADLETEFDSDDTADWQRRWQDDAIVHKPAGITTVRDIPWQNRPTFHQLVQIQRASTDERPAPATAGSRTLPATGGGAAVVGVGLVLAGLGASEARRRTVGRPRTR